MIFESCECPIPSSCEIMKVGRQLYVYLRLKSTVVNGRVLRRKICIGRCKIQGNDRKVLLPNTNYFRHFDKPLPTMETVRDRGRPRRATMRRVAHECIDAWTVTYQKVAQSCALTQVLESAFGHMVAQSVLSNACKAIYYDATTLNTSSLVEPRDFHRFLSMWESLTGDGDQNIFDCFAKNVSSKDLFHCRFFLNRVSGLPSTYVDLLSSAHADNAPDTRKHVQEGSLFIFDPQSPETHSSLECHDRTLKELSVQDSPSIRSRILAWQPTTETANDLESLSCEYRHCEQHGRLFLYRHAPRQALEQESLLRMLSAARSHLSHSPILSQYDQTHLSQYFSIGARQADGHFSFTQKDDVVNAALQCCGTMCLFTTNEKIAPLQALEIYEQIADSRAFLELALTESPLASMSREHQGFLLFIALIIYNRLKHLLCKYPLKKWHSIKQIADHLSKLRLMRTDALWVLQSEADDETLALLKAFDLPVVLSADTVLKNC